MLGCFQLEIFIYRSQVESWINFFFQNLIPVRQKEQGDLAGAAEDIKNKEQRDQYGGGEEVVGVYGY